jgi:hypothetical protein
MCKTVRFVIMTLRIANLVKQDTTKIKKESARAALRLIHNVLCAGTKAIVSNVPQDTIQLHRENVHTA